MFQELGLNVAAARGIDPHDVGWCSDFLGAEQVNDRQTLTRAVAQSRYYCMTDSSIFWRAPS